MITLSTCTSGDEYRLVVQETVDKVRHISAGFFCHISAVCARLRTVRDIGNNSETIKREVKIENNTNFSSSPLT